MKHSQDDQIERMNDAPNAHLMAPGAARPLLSLLVPVIVDLGFHLVRARITSEGEQMILQIMAENDAGTIAIEDCEAISRAVSVMLDVEDPIPGNYTLEVSSPGIDRPLTRLKDFDVWEGYDAKIETDEMIDGRRRFQGTLVGADDDGFRVDVDGAEQTFGYDDVTKTKTVFEWNPTPKPGGGSANNPDRSKKEANS